MQKILKKKSSILKSIWFFPKVNTSVLSLAAGGRLCWRSREPNDSNRAFQQSAPAIQFPNSADEPVQKNKIFLHGIESQSWNRGMQRKN